MARFEARSKLTIVGEPLEWEVLKDGSHYSGPFHSLLAAQEEADWLNSLERVQVKALEITTSAKTRSVYSGEHIGVIKGISGHHILIKAGRSDNDYCIVEKRLFEGTSTSFPIDEKIHIAFSKDGKARVIERPPKSKGVER